MTAIDYLILVVVLGFSIWGWVRGLIAEVFSLASWLIGIWVGIHFGDRAEWLFADVIEQPLLRSILSGFLVGALAFTLVSVLGTLLSKLINSSILGPINRMLGLFFGAARGLLVIALAVLVGMQFELEQAGWWQASRLRPAATTAAELLDSLVDIESLSKRSRQVV